MKGHHIDSRYPLILIIQQHSLFLHNSPSLFVGSLFPVVFVIIQRWFGLTFSVLHESRTVSNIVASLNVYHMVITPDVVNR